MSDALVAQLDAMMTALLNDLPRDRDFAATVTGNILRLAEARAWILRPDAAHGGSNACSEQAK